MTSIDLIVLIEIPRPPGGYNHPDHIKDRPSLPGTDQGNGIHPRRSF